jgi:hypothetical protein
VKQLAGLGRAVKKEKGCWARPCGRKGREGEKRKREWASWAAGRIKKKGEEEEEMGGAKREREREKDAFKCI